MATKSQNSDLSIEGRLEQTLIPNWEEPYRLPKNWCWTKLSIISEFERGITFPASAKESSSSLRNIPCLRTANIQEVLELHDLLFVDRSFMKNNSRKLVCENDIIMSTANSRELVGKTSFVHCLSEEMTFGGFVMAIRSRIDPKYLFYFLRLQFLNGKFMEISTQTTNIANINSTTLGEIATPVPPLDEQKRIVARIESLFLKLDKAKENAQEVVDGLQTRKAAILYKAFSGDLTAKWREKNNRSLDEWENKAFDECVEKMQNGLAKRRGETGVPYVVLRLANLSDDSFITDDLREIMLDDKERKSYKLNVGDVVMIRVNGSKDNVAKQILVTDNNPWAFCDHIIRIRYNECVLPEYAVLFSKSENYKLYVKDNIVSSAGQNTISRKGMAHLNIPVPQIEEQREIVRVLSDLFTKEHNVKETAEAVIDQIDTMKKAILARAFRGELGTNDPNEESALELLKQII